MRSIGGLKAPNVFGLTFQLIALLIPVGKPAWSSISGIVVDFWSFEFYFRNNHTVHYMRV